MPRLEGPQTVPPWLARALGEMGVLEIAGAAHNPRILEYLSTVRGSQTLARRDETAWCSGFVSWCMHKQGIYHRASALAQSWLRQLEPLEKPRLGCVVVMWRGKTRTWRGHVGFLMGFDGRQTLMLGGNQDDAVSIRPYPTARTIGYRWPRNSHGTQTR